jgi:hypothetical protein
MTPLKITVLREGDVAPRPELASKKVVACTLEEAVIIQKGTTGGKASVALLAPLGNGSYAFIETTSGLVNGLWHAMKGAMESWGETLE